MDDYGQKLYRDKKFFEDRFPNFESQQKAAARAIWDRILGRCGIDWGMPPISSIVDLGCGEGSLTIAIAVLAGKRTQAGLGKAIRTIGVDSSEEAIQKANDNLTCANTTSAGIKCEFFPSNESPMKLFHELETSHGVVWKDTALVCLSHTLFHFPDQEQIRNAISKYRPAILLIDVYHTWDDVLKDLFVCQHDQHLEGARRLPDGNVCWLKTEVISRNPQMVNRGLWETHEVDPEKTGRWAFETLQHGISSEALFGPDAEVPGNELSGPVLSLTPGEQLARARGLGFITGEGGCDYIQRKRLFHQSGWGDMRCHALIPRSPVAVELNHAYFDVVRRIVHSLFVGEDSAKRFSNLRDLLKLFDEPVLTTQFAGSREAAIILPFDPNTSFAKYVGMFYKVVDIEISQHDLIVEEPNQVQVRFPTAYGIFHTMEDRISSPQAFPLGWADDYDHLNVDRAFNELEDALLQIKNSPLSSPNHSGANTDSGYFLLPVYFGSLPLFALALKFPSLFKQETTSFHLYFSALTNLHAAIKVALTDKMIRLELLRPWIAAALEKLSVVESCDGKAGDQVREHLDVLEKMLFGEKVGADLASDDSRPFQCGSQSRIGGVLGKKWKSWLLGVPSLPIKKLRTVEAENARLLNLWSDEKDLFLCDHALRLSMWFQQGRFFEDSHEHFDPKIHPGQLARMLVIAGVRPPGLSEVFLVSDAESLAALQERDGKTREGYSYFSSSCKHFLFKWMCKTLSAVAAGSEKEKIDAYLDLKAVFCKSLANHGPRIRFGCRRLFCLIEAALGRPLDCPKPTLHVMKNFDAQCWSLEDPSLSLAEFVHALASLKVGNKTLLDKVEITAPRVGLEQTVTICIRMALSDKMGGKECDQVSQAFEKVKLYEATSTQLFNRTSFTFSLAVLVDQIHGQIKITKG